MQVCVFFCVCVDSAWGWHWTPTQWGGVCGSHVSVLPTPHTPHTHARTNTMHPFHNYPIHHLHYKTIHPFQYQNTQGAPCAHDEGYEKPCS